MNIAVVWIEKANTAIQKYRKVFLFSSNGIDNKNSIAAILLRKGASI
jgi:hypothetical protein